MSLSLFIYRYVIIEETMNYDYRNDFTYNRDNNIQTLPNDMDIRLTSNEKVYQDKTTYCRPVLSYYNEQFIYKTMERNARLKRLVKNLAVARQEEKESVSWNNFINDLKNKHALKNGEIKHTASVKESGEYIHENYNDYYKTRFTCVPSRPCKHLLQEFYGANNASQSQYTYYRQLKENSVRQSQVNKYLLLDRDSYCYPTSSQGRLMMMDKERRNRQLLNNEPSNLSDKYLFVKSRVCHRTIDKAVNTEVYKYIPSYNRIFCHSRATSFDKMISVKADIKLYPHLINHKYDDKVTASTMYETEQNKSFVKDKDDEKLQENPNNMKKLSINNIDTKLETLIKSINKFIDEINIRKQNRIKTDDTKNIPFEYINSASNINSEIYLIENTSFSKHKTKGKFDRTEPDTERKLNRCFLKHSQPFNVNKKIQEYTEKSKGTKLTKGVQFSNKLKNQPRSVQITFEVPTKDCSTEVIKSLSNQNTFSENKDAIIEEICTPVYDFPHQRMTIAVNTDPLSFLGLLRISTDTFKRFLSYMPNIDCYSYLSLLQFPQSTRSKESHYVCNICGADFNKPSKLSDHIRGHNLGVTKDCCICRHVLDKARKAPGLFRCRYCGQPFVRAYCCELHQETCARRFGLHHDVTSSLMLLR